MHFRRLFPFTLILVASGIGGCDREPPPKLQAELQAAKTELEQRRRTIETLEQKLAMKNDELDQTFARLGGSKSDTAQKDAALLEKDQQLAALAKELQSLRRQDALVFAEISAVHQQGRAETAVRRYEEFLKEYPLSPLARHARQALAELTPVVQREAHERVTLIDPRRGERETLRRFRDGTAAAEDLAPLLRDRSPGEVRALLGRPNQLFQNGSEFGYANRVINSSTGRKGMLIVSFERDRVASLRVDYAGRKFAP